MLRKLGHGVQCYAELVVAEASGDTASAEQALQDCLVEINVAQTNLLGLMKVDPNQTSLWLLRDSI